MNELNMNTSYTGQPAVDEMNTAPLNTLGQTPQNMKIDDKAIKKLAGEAISQVPGVLGLEGGLTGIINNVIKQQAEDVTQGLNVQASDDGSSVDISAKIITEYGKNIPAIVAEVQDKVSQTLHSMAGLAVGKVQVEVTDTMTREDYQAKISKGQPHS